MTRALQLRTETVETMALPDSSSATAASWTYTAAAEDLVRTLTGLAGEHEADDRADLAGQLRDIEERCTPDGTHAAAAGPQASMPTTRAALDVARMATAITLLHQGKQQGVDC